MEWSTARTGHFHAAQCYCCDLGRGASPGCQLAKSPVTFDSSRFAAARTLRRTAVPYFQSQSAIIGRLILPSRKVINLHRTTFRCISTWLVSHSGRKFSWQILTKSLKVRSGEHIAYQMNRQAVGKTQTSPMLLRWQLWLSFYSSDNLSALRLQHRSPSRCFRPNLFLDDCKSSNS